MARAGVWTRFGGGRERTRAAVFVAAWLLSLLLVWTAASAYLPRPVPPSGPIQATLQIRTPSWAIAYHAGTENNTVFGLLRQANETMGFELHWVQYGWPYDDVFVTSINGTKNDGSRNLWWQYCVNGAYASVGASSQPVRDGDLVKWVYSAPGGNELCR